MLGLIKYIVAAVCALVFIICFIVAIRKFSKGKRTGGIVATVFAVTVVDMAENIFGNKVFLVAESNTPARDKHVMRNFLNPAYSPWFTLNQKAAKDDYVMRLPFRFYGDNIRRF